jgi:hypothetical protein
MAIKVHTHEFGEFVFPSGTWFNDDTGENHTLTIHENLEEFGDDPAEDDVIAVFAEKSWWLVVFLEDEEAPEPRVARVWGLIAEVPTNVVVTDEDGDRWKFIEGTWLWEPTPDAGFRELVRPNDHAPFTEVLDA